MFTESLPSNKRQFWLYCSGFRALCHNIKMDIKEVSCIAEDFIYLAQDMIQLRPIADRNSLAT
jgi:hypothetical protein